MPTRVVLYLRWILGHKIVGKGKFWDFRRLPDCYANAKQSLPNYGNYCNYIPRFYFVKSCNVFKDFFEDEKKKKPTTSFITKFGWNFLWFPYFYFQIIKNQWNKVWLILNINILFAVCVSHVPEHLIVPSSFIQLWISRKPVDTSRCTSFIRVK